MGPGPTGRRYETQHRSPGRGVRRATATEPTCATSEDIPVDAVSGCVTPRTRQRRGGREHVRIVARIVVRRGQIGGLVLGQFRPGRGTVRGAALAASRARRPRVVRADELHQQRPTFHGRGYRRPSVPVMMVTPRSGAGGEGAADSSAAAGPGRVGARYIRSGSATRPGPKATASASTPTRSRAASTARSSSSRPGYRLHRVDAPRADQRLHVSRVVWGDRRAGPRARRRRAAASSPIGIRYRFSAGAGPDPAQHREVAHTSFTQRAAGGHPAKSRPRPNPRRVPVVRPGKYCARVDQNRRRPAVATRSVADAASWSRWTRNGAEEGYS